MGRAKSKSDRELCSSTNNKSDQFTYASEMSCDLSLTFKKAEQEREEAKTRFSEKLLNGFFRRLWKHIYKGRNVCVVFCSSFCFWIFRHFYATLLNVGKSHMCHYSKKHKNSKKMSFDRYIQHTAAAFPFSNRSTQIFGHKHSRR